jgi:hypothetical protein
MLSGWVVATRHSPRSLAHARISHSYQGFSPGMRTVWDIAKHKMGFGSHKRHKCFLHQDLQHEDYCRKQTDDSAELRSSVVICLSISPSLWALTCLYQVRLWRHIKNLSLWNRKMNLEYSWTKRRSESRRGKQWDIYDWIWKRFSLLIT